MKKAFVGSQKCQDVMEGETGQTFQKVKHRLLINPMKTSKP